MITCFRRCYRDRIHLGRGVWIGFDSNQSLIMFVSYRMEGRNSLELPPSDLSRLEAQLVRDGGPRVAYTEFVSQTYGEIFGVSRYLHNRYLKMEMN